MLRFFFFQAEDGIRDLVRSRGLGDVYKRQARRTTPLDGSVAGFRGIVERAPLGTDRVVHAGSELRCRSLACLLYTSDAADERSSVDLGGRRIIKKKKTEQI